jgi:hypothetical protein
MHPCVNETNTNTPGVVTPYTANPYGTVDGPMTDVWKGLDEQNRDVGAGEPLSCANIAHSPNI